MARKEHDRARQDSLIRKAACSLGFSLASAETELVEVPIPEDLRLSTFSDQFLFNTRSDWTVGGDMLPAFSLSLSPHAIPFVSFAHANLLL